jgi:hypothetical protein
MEGKAEKGGLATRSKLANEWNHPACGSIFHFGAQILSRLLYRDSSSWLSLRSIYYRFQGNDCPVYLTALTLQLLEDSTNVNFCHVASPCLPSGEDHDGYGLRRVHCTALVSVPENSSWVPPPSNSVAVSYHHCGTWPSEAPKKIDVPV